MIPDFSLQHFRFPLEPQVTFQMPACLPEYRQAHNKGSTLRLRPEARPEGQCHTGRVCEHEGVVRFDSKAQRR
jgi:hypothetical protein